MHVLLSTAAWGGRRRLRFGRGVGSDFGDEGVGGANEVRAQFGAPVVWDRRGDAEVGPGFYRVRGSDGGGVERDGPAAVHAPRAGVVLA